MANSKLTKTVCACFLMCEDNPTDKAASYCNSFPSFHCTLNARSMNFAQIIPHTQSCAMRRAHFGHHKQTQHIAIQIQDKHQIPYMLRATGQIQIKTDSFLVMAQNRCQGKTHHYPLGALGPRGQKSFQALLPRTLVAYKTAPSDTRHMV